MALSPSTPCLRRTRGTAPFRQSMSAKGGVMEDRVPPPPPPPPPLSLGRRDSCFSTTGSLLDKDSSYLRDRRNPKKCDNSNRGLTPGSTLLEKSVRNKNWQSGWTRRRSCKPETKASAKDRKGCHCRHDVRTQKQKGLTNKVDMELNAKEMKGNKGRKCNKCTTPQNPPEKVYQENVISPETIPVLSPGTAVIKRRMPPRSKRRAKKLSTKSTGVRKVPVEIDEDSRLSPLPQGGIRLPYKRPFYSLALQPVEIEQDLALISNFKRRRTTRGNHHMGSMADDMSSCAIVLLRLKNHELGSFFNQPVAKSEWSREAKELYFLHVDSPLDLGTIQARLSSGEYTHSVLFADDVRAVFRNAAMCSASGSAVQGNALRLWRLFEDDVALYGIAATESVVIPRLPDDTRGDGTVVSVSVAVSNIAPVVTSTTDICHKRKGADVDHEARKSPEKKACTQGSRGGVREKMVFLPVADTAVLTFAKPRTRTAGRRKQFRSSVSGANCERESTTSASDVARHSSNDSGKEAEEKEIQTERFESLLALEEAGRSLLQVSNGFNNESGEKRSLSLEESVLLDLKNEHLPSNVDTREAENGQFVTKSQPDKEPVLKLKRPRGRPSLDKNGGKKEDHLVDGKKGLNCKSEQVYSRAKKGEKEGVKCEYAEKTEQRCARVYSFLAEAVEIYSPVRGEGPKEFSLEWLHPVRTQRRRGRTVSMVATTGRSREGRTIVKGEKSSTEISGGEISDGVRKGEDEAKFEQGSSGGNLTTEQTDVIRGGNTNQWKGVEWEERKEEMNQFRDEKSKYVVGEPFTETKLKAVPAVKVRDGSPVEVGATPIEGGGLPRNLEEGIAAEQEVVNLLEQLKRGSINTENEMMPKQGYSSHGKDRETENERELLASVKSHEVSSSSARTGRPFLEKWRPLSASLAKGEGKIKSHSVFTVKQGVAVKVPPPPPPSTSGLSQSVTSNVTKPRAGFLKGSGMNTESVDFQGGNPSQCPTESEISISNVVPSGDSSVICSKTGNSTQQSPSVLGSKSVFVRNSPNTPLTSRLSGSTIGSIVPRQTTPATFKKVQTVAGQEKPADGIQKQFSDGILKPSKDQLLNPHPVSPPEFPQKTVSDVLNPKRNEDSHVSNPCGSGKNQIDSICEISAKQISSSSVQSLDFVQSNSAPVALISGTPTGPPPSESNSSVVTEVCTGSFVGSQYTKRTKYPKNSLDRGNSVAGSKSVSSSSGGGGGDKGPSHSPWLELLANALQEDDSLSQKSIGRKEKEFSQIPPPREESQRSGSSNASTLSSVVGSIVSTGQVSVLDQTNYEEKPTFSSSRAQVVVGNKDKIWARKLDSLLQVSELVSLERSSLGTMTGSISTPALTSV